MSFLEKLRAKTNRQKRKYVLLFSISITLIIALVWFVSFVSLNKGEDEIEDIVEEEPVETEPINDDPFQIQGLQDQLEGTFQDGPSTEFDEYQGGYENQ